VKFQPTLVITDDFRREVTSGVRKIRKGQWVLDGRTGRRGRFLGLRKTLHVVEYKRGLSFRQHIADFRAAL
jgi:hypothetical protein